MPIEIKDNIVRLENRFCRRHIDISNGPFSRDVFTRSPENAYFCPHHHLNEQAIPFETVVPAAAVFINPAPAEQRVNATMPLHYAGFRLGGKARDPAGAEFELDERAAAAVALRLGPYEARTISFFPAG